MGQLSHILFWAFKSSLNSVFISNFFIKFNIDSLKNFKLCLSRLSLFIIAFLAPNVIDRESYIFQTPSINQQPYKFGIIKPKHINSRIY